MSDGLELISGMVRGLTIHDGEQAFLSEAQQGSGAAVAAGLATAGLAGAAAGAGLAATSTGDAVQFFTCQLGERTVAGGFSKVTFKNGDEVSFVVARQPRAADRALAAIRPRDHTLWRSLHCSRGVRAHRRFAYGVFLRLVVGLPVFFCASYLASSLFSFGPKIDAGTFHVVLPMFSTFGVVAAIYYGLRFYFQWRPVAQQAERIFAVLGYPNPSRVDLPRDHKRYSKARVRRTTPRSAAEVADRDPFANRPNSANLVFSCQEGAGTHCLLCQRVFALSVCWPLKRLAPPLP